MTVGYAWNDVLKGASKIFMDEIVAQMPDSARDAFETLLDSLTKHVSDEIEYDLRKLSALEAGGVDNWEWYDDAMESLREEEDED